MSTSTSTSKSRLGSETGDLAMTSDLTALHNYLPLIVCRFLNNPRDVNLLDEHQKFAYIDLILLVFEKNGYLFLCCPRLTSNTSLSALNIDSHFEQLLLEEQNISLSYSALQLISSSFFAQSKSIKHLEIFITKCMPFGKLLKDGADLMKQPIDRKADKSNGDSTLIRLCINEFVSTSFQTFSRNSTKEGETIFGTFTVDAASLSPAEYSKAEVKIAVDNLSSFTIAKPPNCELLNASTLSFNLKNAKLDPMNLLHYRLKSGEDESKQGTGSNDLDNRKIFSYRYVIGAKSSAVRSARSVISARNCQHLAVVISFNGHLPVDEIKFGYFQIKFSFKHSKPKGEVQTADSSFSNLIVRDSIKASFGQVRNEGANFFWNIGQKIPKSGKLSLEFDILADESKLSNLETVCNFRFEHRVALKLAYTKKVTSLVADSSQGRLIGRPPEELEEMRECQPKQFCKLIEPHLLLSKLMLQTELHPNQLSIRAPERRSESKPGGNLVLFEYRLASFEYRLLPETAKL